MDRNAAKKLVPFMNLSKGNLCLPPSNSLILRLLGGHLSNFQFDPTKVTMLQEEFPNLLSLKGSPETEIVNI